MPVDSTELRAGAAARPNADSGRLTGGHRRCSLEELLAQCDHTADEDADMAWVNGGPVGDELL